MNTVITAVVNAARSPAEIAAESWVLLKKFVGRPTPFQRTTDPGTKLAPVTASVNAGDPIVAELGLMAVIDGRGTDEPPIPYKPTTCGLPAALSKIVNVPLREPALVGVNVTLPVQEAKGAMLEPQPLL